MKWIFLAFLLVMTPALAAWLKQNGKYAPVVWASIGGLPFVTAPWHLYVAPISWPMWPGWAKGMEISLLDALALAILISAPAGRRILPFKILLLAFLAAMLLSIMQSEMPLSSFFAAWQTARMVLVVSAVATACVDRRAPPFFVMGMVGGLGVQAAISLQERFSGALQAGGSLGHQNLLGLMSHFVVFPAVAMLLGGNRSWAAITGPVAGMTAAILTASRATIGLAGPGYVLTILISIARKPTQSKFTIAGIGVIGLAIAAPLAMATLRDRFEASPLQQDYDERAAFERAAKMIVADHPLGVGANNYVLVVNTMGYAERARIEPTYGSRSANVHNVYLLMASEIGIPGAIIFTILMLTAPITGIAAYMRGQPDQNAELLLGLSVSILIVGIHSLFEWIFVMFSSQYLFAICLGLIGGIIRYRGSALELPAGRRRGWIDIEQRRQRREEAAAKAEERQSADA